MRIKRLLAGVIAALFVLQLLPLNLVTALDPGEENLTGSKYLAIHDPDAAENPSMLELKYPGGGPIPPEPDGSYNNVPEGATISLHVAFHLENGDESAGVQYEYLGGEHFTFELPQGIRFDANSGSITAIDSVAGSYTLADWTISGRTLEVTLRGEVQGKVSVWGKIELDGTFLPLGGGDSTSTQIQFGSKVITINREPLPVDSTLGKSGTYDASTNRITWEVTITPPTGDPNLSYKGFTLVDTFRAGQTFANGSFAVGAIPVADSELNLTDLASRTFSYTFPDDTTGVQTVTYQTEVEDFSNGATFTNAANLKKGSADASNTASDNVTLNWMEKSGALAATATDPTVVKWTVQVDVPGEDGKAITGAQIIDNLATDLELLADVDHPVQIQFGSNPAENVSSGGGEGGYSYAPGTRSLTYSFDVGYPKAGETATLTFFTKVLNSERDKYLNDNGQISFSNTAGMTWDENPTGPEPSATANSAENIGEGGLLSKSGGSNSNYTYSDTDPGTIHWTITVNRNRINITNAAITDTVPVGQELLIDGSHPFTVKSGAATVATITSASSTGNFTYTDERHFSYDFGAIVDTFTIEYDTRVTKDTSGTGTLYKNGDVNFGNDVNMTRSGASVDASGTKTYHSELLNKSIVRNYDCNDRLVQWQMVINRNRLPLTNAEVSDSIHAGMELFIDSTHKFTVVEDGTAQPIDEFTSVSSSGSLTVAAGAGEFTYALPPSTSKQYTVTYWTKMKEEALKTQWNGTKGFANEAELTANEITSKVSDTETAQVRNPVITKKYTYAQGNDYIDWEAIVNPGQVLLANGIVKDKLNPGLELDPDSVKLYEISVDGASSEPDSDIREVPGEEFSLTLPTAANDNTLSVHLPANTRKTYRLEFSTMIAADSLTLTNQIELDGSAGEPTGSADASQFQIFNLYSSGGSGPNQLTVLKQDENGDPLDGAVFRLLTPAKQPMRRSNANIELTTGAAGTPGEAVFTNLPSWAFYVQEITPPLGYVLPAEPIQGGTRLNAATPTSYTFSNELAVGDVSFSKTGAGGALLTGGTFTLTGRDYKDDAVSLTAQAVNGVVTFADVPLGKEGTSYTIEETVAPQGHSLNPSATPLTATVVYNAEKTGVSVTVTPNSISNAPIPDGVSFTKKGPNGELLNGGTFTLTGTSAAGSAVSEQAAAVNGVVSFADIPIGTYIITETIAPAGYLLPADTEILTAVVAYNPANNGLTATLRDTTPATAVTSEVTNAGALGTISFAKISKAGLPLTGGTFTLTGSDYAGREVALSASAVDGTVTFTDVPLNATGESYTIRETVAPRGYRRSSEELTASVSYDAAKTGVVTSISANTFTNTLLPPSSPEPVEGSIEIKKTDDSGKKLAGATFKLYQADNNSFVASAVSNADGIARFDAVPEGKYVLRETDAPEGYALSTQAISIDVTTDKTLTYTVVNKDLKNRPGSIRVHKTDAEGKSLAGAEFTLYDASGKPMASAVSGSDGLAVFNKVPVGAYTLSETRVPDGYLKAADASVTVENAKESSLTVVNKKKTEESVGSLLISKVDKDGKPLSGAKFTLYQTDGTVLGTALSGEDGVARFTELAAGTVIVRETAAPAGYKRVEDSLTVQVQAGGSHTYTLENVRQDEESPAKGWLNTSAELPKTGIPGTFYAAFSGLLIATAVLLLSRPGRARRRSRMSGM